MIGRLQFLRKKNICINRDAALSKVEELKKTSLPGEPIVIQYYDNDKLELMLCIGTKDAENVKGYHIIDTHFLDDKIAENLKEIVRVEGRLNGEILRITSIIEDNASIFNNKLNEEKIARENKDSEITSLIDSVKNEIDAAIDFESKNREDSVNTINENINTLNSDIISKINLEKEERIAEDATINSRVDEQTVKLNNEIVNRVKGDINKTSSEKNTINSTLIKNDDGTTLSFDVNLDSSSEFLTYDDGGLTDKGIKEHVETKINEVKDLLSSYTDVNGSSIEDIKNNIKTVEGNVQTNANRIQEHVDNDSIHVTSQQKIDWQNATNAINAFLKNAENGDKALDTLKELQYYIEAQGGVASGLINDVANNKTAIEIINADENKQGSIDYKIKASNNAVNAKISSLENEDINIKNSVERSLSNLDTKFNNEVISLKQEDLAIKENISNNVSTLNTRISTEVNTLNTKIDNNAALIDTKINAKADATTLAEEINEREKLSSLVNTKVDKTLYENRVSALESNDEKINTSINTLNSLVGKDSVAMQISSAINTLHFDEATPEGQFVINVHQTDGRIDTIERRPFSAITKSVDDKLITTNEEILTINENIGNINENYIIINGRLNSHDVKITNLETETASIKERLSANDEKHSNLDETINLLQEKDEKLNGQCNELQRLIDSLNNELSSKGKEINALKEDLSSKTTEINELNVQVTQLESEVSGLTAYFNNVNANLSNLMGRLEELFGGDIMTKDIKPITEIKSGEGSEISVEKDGNTVTIDFNEDLLGNLKEIE